MKGLAWSRAQSRWLIERAKTVAPRPVLRMPEAAVRLCRSAGLIQADGSGGYELTAEGRALARRAPARDVAAVLAQIARAAPVGSELSAFVEREEHEAQLRARKDDEEPA